MIVYDHIREKYGCFATIFPRITCDRITVVYPRDRIRRSCTPSVYWDNKRPFFPPYTVVYDCVCLTWAFKHHIKRRQWLLYIFKYNRLFLFCSKVKSKTFVFFFELEMSPGRRWQSALMNKILFSNILVGKLKKVARISSIYFFLELRFYANSKLQQCIIVCVSLRVYDNFFFLQSASIGRLEGKIF